MAKHAALLLLPLAVAGCASTVDDAVAPPPPSFARTMDAECGTFVDATNPSSPRVLVSSPTRGTPGAVRCMRVRVGQDVSCDGEPRRVTHIEKAGPIVVSCGSQDGPEPIVFYVDAVP
jgi:hypothetical protein